MAKAKPRKTIYLNINKRIFFNYFIQEIIRWNNHNKDYSTNYILGIDGSVHLREKILEEDLILCDIFYFKTDELEKDMHDNNADKMSYFSKPQIYSWFIKSFPKNLVMKNLEYRFKFI